MHTEKEYPKGKNDYKEIEKKNKRDKEKLAHVVPNIWLALSRPYENGTSY